MPKSSRRRIYIGRLDRRTRARDLESVFNRYGRIRDLELKRDYAFIEYYEPRDAEDAVRDMDGRKFDGARIIVEYAGSDKSDRASTSEDTCFNCGQTGHWANNCKEGDWKDKCYSCGKKGHMKRDCQASKSRSRSRDRTRERGRRRDNPERHDDNDETKIPRNRSKEKEVSIEKTRKEDSPVIEEYES